MAQHYSIAEYNELNVKLNTSPYSRAIRFLNLGYVPSPLVARQSRIDLSDTIFARNNAELVCEIVGTTDLERKDILDICCGRGGTTALLNKYFHPRSVTGIDASDIAIEFCNKYCMADNAKYITADYKELPFPDNHFDIVISIEPYYEYPGAEQYVNEVDRVLKPGGTLLYSNLLPSGDFVFMTRWITGRKMIIERDQDITECVIQSSKENDRSEFRNILGDSELESFNFGKNSNNLSNITSGRRIYRIIRAVKEVYSENTLMESR